LRIFLSFNSKDTALAEAIRFGLCKLEPGADIFFSPASLGSGFWQSKLAAGIDEADAFLLLVGPKGIGPWQEPEYFAAFDRHVKDKTFALVPVMATGAQAPGLSFLRSLNWVEAPSVTEDTTLHRVLAALKGNAAKNTTPLWKLVNPYRGLEAMTEANADYFYSRSIETSVVLNALAAKPHRLPILIGASGVGKSSVAQAGVLAALKAMRWPGDGHVDGTAWPTGLANSRSFLTLTMRPGDRPLEALAGAFIDLWRIDTKDPEQAALPRKWAKSLSAGDNKLAELIGATQEELKKRGGEAPERVLLYLDQGEELYTRAIAKDAHRFSELLSEGLHDPRLLAFASLRADYFDRFQADEPLFGCREHIDVPPLDRSQLLQVVTGPAAALGVSFEDGKLADRITAAAAAEPGALPLLSYLLTDMWAEMVHRDKPVLGLSTHAIDVGGVLAGRAEAFLKENPEAEKVLRRLLTLRFAIVPPEGEPVRRQTFRDECSEAEWALAARLADHPYRLVVMSEREVRGRVVAEVAHEALLRAWPRLAQWLREERDFLVFKGETEHAERRWRDMGQLDRALLTGLDLARAEEWLPKRPSDLSTAVTAYVQRSIAFDRALKERQLRFQRRVALGAMAAALLMTMVGVFAWVQWGNAHRATLMAVQEKARADSQLAEAQRTQSLFLADLAGQKIRAGDAVTAMLLSIEALPDNKLIDRPLVPEAELRLASAANAAREQRVLAGHSDNVVFASFSADGSRAVTASVDRSARIWDVVHGKLIATLTGHEQAVNSATFSPDGSRVVTASNDGSARLWASQDGRLIAILPSHDGGAVFTALFDRDGQHVVTASADTTARIWDGATGRLLSVLPHPAGVNSAEFSADGSRIVTACDDGKAYIWNAANDRKTIALPGHAKRVSSATFSPDGSLVVTTSDDHTGRLWNAATGDIIKELPHNSNVTSAQFSTDGTKIVTASQDRQATVWNGHTGELLASLGPHDSYVTSAQFSPDGQRVVTTSSNEVRLWSTATGSEIDRLGGHTATVGYATFNPEGHQILTVSDDRTARLWNGDISANIVVLTGHQNSVWTATVSPDGRTVLTASDDKTARLWDSATGRELRKLLFEDGVNDAAFSPDGKHIVVALDSNRAQILDATTSAPLFSLDGQHSNHVNTAFFSPDGRYVVTASDDGTAILWDAATGSFIRRFTGHGGGVNSAAFSSDGKRLVTASSDKTAQIWDTVSGAKIVTLVGHAASVHSAVFDASGDHVLTASWDNTARIWDSHTSKLIAPLLGHLKYVYTARFSPDGKRVVTASADESARIWDSATGAPMVSLDGQSGALYDAEFSPDGQRVATAASDRTVRVWRLDPPPVSIQALVDAAIARAPRCLSSDQRARFFLAASPPDWCRGKWPY
jgi:WD40 repeat protein